VAASTTLILGAGFGGIATANALRRQLSADHRIILIDKAPTFHFGAAKPWVMLGHKTIDEVCYPRDALAGRGIEFLHTQVRRIDLAKGEVATDRGTQRGDYLVIALGADYDMSAIPGLAAAHEFYTLEGAPRLRDALRGFKQGDLVMLVPRTPFKCPPAPSECALLLHDFLTTRGVRNACEITLVMPFGVPIPPSPATSQALLAGFAERGITFVANTTESRRPSPLSNQRPMISSVAPTPRWRP